MNDQNLYYIAPSDEIFWELQLKTISLTITDDISNGLKIELIQDIIDIYNISDGFMALLSKTHETEEKALFKLINRETRKAIDDRLIAGGTTP